MSYKFTGRRVIYTDEEYVDTTNIQKVIRDSLATHAMNYDEIEYLYKYYKGDQPVLYRQKEYRPEVNNKVCENRANAIVSFKTGYFIGEDGYAYVSREGNKEASDQITLLNKYMSAEDKITKDVELADWMHICGTAFRVAIPDYNALAEEDEAPFEIYTLDPRDTFVVYNSGLGHRPMAGVTYAILTDGRRKYSVYTDREYFELDDGLKITKQEGHALGMIPIIEYPANDSRLGSFEIVMTMLDAINEIESNKVDAIQQFVDSLMVFTGADIDSSDFTRIKELGAVCLPENSDVKYITQQLNQTDTQTAVNKMYDTVLDICGMPKQTGTGTSGNGVTALFVNGWTEAEARTRVTDNYYKKSERLFLKLICKLSNDLRNMELKLSDIDIRASRRNHENMQSKAQILCQLLNQSEEGNLDPKLAFIYSGMFVDPELAYNQSEQWRKQFNKEQSAKLEDQQDNLNEPAPEDTTDTTPQVNTNDDTK